MVQGRAKVVKWLNRRESGLFSLVASYLRFRHSHGGTGCVPNIVTDGLSRTTPYSLPLHVLSGVVLPLPLQAPNPVQLQLNTLS